MSSQISQSPSITLSKITSKVTKQYTVKSKSSNKKSLKTKKSIKNINKDIKVVYISNPIKFEVNADGFQALVQGLTGKDADNDNNDNSTQDVTHEDDNGGFHHDEIIDEVQQEPFDDDQVQVDGYDGSCGLSSLDYFGAFDGSVSCGDESKGYMTSIYGGFSSFYD